MGSLRLLKNRSHQIINNMFKSIFAKSQTTLLLTDSNAKLDNASINSETLEQHNKTYHHRNPVETTPKRLNIYITVETQWFTSFRQLIMSNFKGDITSIRVEPIDHARKMKVCLCFDRKVEDKLMTLIMRSLPSAEFGRISRVQV